MKLIVGLGNPGEKYAGNRHNIGFLAVDELARGYSFGPWKKRFQGLTSEGQVGLERCILLKPSTYMNESGRAVGEAMRFYKIPLADVIVIHDEIDLKPGAIRVKTGGGNAGHNGLRSVSAHIGNEYRRVRLGVDHPGDKALVANYVLQDFSKSDQAWLIPLLEGVARGMAKLVEGSEAAFLSEAARGRKPSARAAKLNGATPPEAEAASAEEPAHGAETLKPLHAEAHEPAPEAAERAAQEPEATEVEAPTPAREPEAAAPEIEGLPHAEAAALATIVAAASRPIEPMPAPTVAAAPIAQQPTPLAARAPEPAPVAEPIETAIAEAETETVLEARSEAEIVHHPGALETIAAPELEPAPAAEIAETAEAPEPIPHPSAAETVEAVATQPAPEAEPVIHRASVETVQAPEPEAVPHPAAVDAVEAVAPQPEPEPEHPPHPAAAVAVQAPEPEAIPHPAAVETAQAPAPTEAPKAAEAKPAAAEASAKKPETAKPASPKPQAPPSAKKQGNIFSRWFRSRVRGGGHH
jgi:PTH1 family peptidyl-tRNA hydrolase